jgi:hypothetical protein
MTCQHCYCSEGYLSVHTRWGCTITNPVTCCKCRAEKPPGVKANEHRPDNDVLEHHKSQYI